MPAIVDTNIYLSRWPFRRLPDDETADMAASLQRQGVVRAWAGSFDGLLHRDMSAVNARLADECSGHGGLFLPFGSINPTLPDWEEDLRRCHEEHGMPGIRLHPNYHGYTLDQPVAARLLELAAERNLLVQLALSMEDERTQHPRLQVPHVDAGPLPEIVKRLPGLRLVVLNAFRALHLEQLDALASAGSVYFEIAMLEGVGGVSRLIQQVTADRILFGSYSPFFYFESALLKLQESALAGAQEQAIREENARRLLA